jgi:hypothetical protein
MKMKTIQATIDRTLLVIQGDSVQQYQVSVFEPPTDGIIRIDNYRQNIVIEDDGNGGSLVQASSQVLTSHQNGIKGNNHSILVSVGLF